MVGREMFPHKPTITLTPTTTRYITSYDIYYAKICNIRLTLKYGIPSKLSIQSLPAIILPYTKYKQQEEYPKIKK